jgi:hypothetical protein
VKSGGSAVMAKRPLLIMFSKPAVGFLKSAPVFALPMEMFGLAAAVGTGHRGGQRPGVSSGAGGRRRTARTAYSVSIAISSWRARCPGER